MSSINPVVLLPGALKARAADIAAGFAASLTLGVGQFCTNPGLVLGLAGADLDRFAQAAVETLPPGEIEFLSTDFAPFRGALAGTRWERSPVSETPRALAAAIGRIGARLFARGLAHRRVQGRQPIDM
mgnify:CR=1 FL=1